MDICEVLVLLHNGHLLGGFVRGEKEFLNVFEQSTKSVAIVQALTEMLSRTVQAFPWDEMEELSLPKAKREILFF